MKRTLLLIVCVLASISMQADKTEINKQNFPDENFRNFVLSTAIDRNQNKILDEDEILRVTNIDVHQKGIVSLKGIEYFTELQKLTCYQNNLTDLDLSACTKLDFLNCPWNKLVSLNLSNCAKLKWIRCDQNQLPELDVSACTELDTLVCSANKISTLDVSACTKLDYLNCQYINITKLDVSNNTELVTLYCDMNHLTELDLSKNTKLEVCTCSGNGMTKLILSKDNVLNYLGCSTNKLYGAAMEHIVENLNYQQQGGSLDVFNAENKDLERNVITTKQVEALNAKGWQVYQWIYSWYCLYTGIDVPDDSDYIPFVEEGKQWHVARFTPGRKNMEEVDYYIPQGVEEINGNEYYKMKAIVNNTTEIETYLVREENRKLYLYNPDLEAEFLVFDFSLKEGDVYEGYSDELHPMVRFKVVSVGDCTEGPQIREYYYDEEADTMAVRYRYLRKWDVMYADFGGAIGPWSWVEGIGSLMNPFTSMSDGYSTLDHLTYITYNSYVGHPDNYLPFSFIEWWNGEWHGCNMPTSAESFYSEDGHHQLTYELEGKRLHVYGKVLTHGGDNNYAYFIPEPTEDSSVRKFRFKIQEIEPLPDPLPDSDGLALHATDFYVEDLNPAIDYIVVDNQGVEHTVINRAPLNVYRPFVEDGKVWVVKVTSDDEPTEEWFEYYYFDGDTIINGQAAKRMLCDRIGSWQDTSGEYVGAWYEQDKKVYYAANGKQQFELLYDFTMNNYDEMPNPDGSGSVWIVYKWTGIYTGFKGTSYTFGQFGQERWYERVGSNSWPFVNHPWGYPGDKGVLTACIVGDEVIYYNSDEGDPFGMGAKKGRFDFTHTIKIQPKAPARRGAERKQTNDAEALSVYGEYNEKQLCINFDPLDAAYQVSITDESGKTVYERAVTAITIVALNIDISTYAEGRYTVTVENSHESFTGEFEVQTTGIKVVEYKKNAAKSGVYDLQGRRMVEGQPLQRGIYVKDGRKFVVK